MDWLDCHSITLKPHFSLHLSNKEADIIRIAVQILYLIFEHKVVGFYIAKCYIIKL